MLTKIEGTAQRRCPGCHNDAGEEAPYEPESSGEDEGDEDEEEGEIIFPRAPLPENLPSLGAFLVARWGPC
jgi:hypothetical protein